jgi:hypothetical protein
MPHNANASPSLLTSLCLNLFSHQANLIDSRTFGDVDHFDDVGEEQVGICVHENGAVVAGLEDFLEAIAEETKLDVILVDLDEARIVDRHNDGSI